MVITTFIPAFSQRLHIFIAPKRSFTIRPYSPTFAKPFRTPLSRRTYMIAQPDSDGLPDLNTFSNPARSTVGTQGPPIKFSVARCTLTQNDSFAATTTALQTALRTVPNPVLAHITFGPLCDPTSIRDAVRKSIGNTPVIARSVEKKDASNVIEVLLLSSDTPSTIQVASVSEAVTTSMDVSLQKAAKLAAQQAIQKLDDVNACTFLVFAHTPANPESARKGLNEASADVVAYGGPASGPNDKWSLFGDEDVADDPADKQTVICAAVAGSISYLPSSVIKNWVQPVYVEALSYLTPQYVGDATKDLLTAIRYSDWEKFKWCLEEGNVETDERWTDKQNQTPLLASCARARTDMIEYLLEKGANVEYKNDKGFTALMYSMMLAKYDEKLIKRQLEMLRKAGARMELTEDEKKLMERMTGVKGN